MSEQLYSNFRRPVLLIDALKQSVPSAFAEQAHPRASLQYRFIATHQIIGALGEAGFYPVEARQGQPRVASLLYARHLIRFRRELETVTLADSIPELVLLNSHDGSTAYRLSAGLYRPICTNGLMVSQGTLEVVHVAHRRTAVRDVVEAALRIAGQFARLGELVEQMIRRGLTLEEREAFAQHALRLRFGTDDLPPIDAEMIRSARRIEDAGVNAWVVLNSLQENCLKGGQTWFSTQGRRYRTRAIRAIRREVEINRGLWQYAMRLIGA